MVRGVSSSMPIAVPKDMAVMLRLPDDVRQADTPPTHCPCLFSARPHKPRRASPPPPPPRVTCHACPAWSPVVLVQAPGSSVIAHARRVEHDEADEDLMGSHHGLASTSSSSSADMGGQRSPSHLQHGEEEQAAAAV